MKRIIAYIIAGLSLVGCVEQHGMQQIGEPGPLGTLYAGQACTDQICAAGIAVAALYGPRGQIIPLSPVGITSLGERAATAGVLAGALITAGWADGVSHPAPRK